MKKAYQKPEALITELNATDIKTAAVGSGQGSGEGSEEG